MKVERWEEESDEDWAERLINEIKVANNTETTRYFIECDPYAEDNFIINYVGETGWTWMEHPEGPFSCKQVLEWRNKAEKFDRLFPSLEYLAIHADKIIGVIEGSKMGERDEEND